ncbi:MAG: glycosyltransferase family 39 protein [Parcubacteria group bacterium]
MKKGKLILALSFVIIIAAFFRLYNLKSIPPGLYPDEAMNGSNALEAIETNNWKVFYPENGGREGLFINIQSLFIKIFGVNEPWVLRLASVLFGIAGVIGVFFLASELFKNNKNRFRIALLSSLLMAGSFWHINFSRIGFRAIMAPTFLIWASYLLLLAFQKRDKLWKNLCLGLLSGLVYGLGIHSYISYRATPLIIAVPLIFFLIKAIKERELKKFFAPALAFVSGTIVAVYPLVSYFISNPADFFGRTSQISVFSSVSPLKDLILNALKTVLMFNFVGDMNWRHNFSGAPELSILAGIFFLLGLFFAGKKIFTRAKEPMSEWFLLVWLAVSLLPVVISNEGIPHALRAIIAIPAVMIIAAIGMDYFGEKMKDWFYKVRNGKILFRICVTIIFAFLIAEPFIMYFVLWGKNPHVAGAFNENYVEIARAINSLPKETEKYVVVLAGGTEVRGIPMPAQTVKFMTNSFTEKGMEENNIRYFKSYDELPADRESAVIFTVE